MAHTNLPFLQLQTAISLFKDVIKDCGEPERQPITGWLLNDLRGQILVFDLFFLYVLIVLDGSLGLYISTPHTVSLRNAKKWGVQKTAVLEVTYNLE